VARPALKFVALVVPLAIASGAGFVLHARLSARTLRQRIVQGGWSTGTTAADFLGKAHDLEALLAAYDEGPAVLPRLAELSWSPPCAPAPFVGFVPEPGKHQNATINSRGMRSAVEVAVPKPAGTRRVFVVGGSVAYGSGASSQERTIGGRLERLLAKSGPVEVFTAACPHWTTTNERILVEDILVELEPDAVVSVSGMNDIYFGSVGRNVLDMRAPADALFFELARESFDLAGLGPVPDLAPATNHATPPEVIARRAAANARLAAAALAPLGARYLYALQPNIFATKKPLTPRERDLANVSPQTPGIVTKSYDEIRRAFAGSVDLVDATDAFDGVTDAVFLDSVHVADRGNDLIARRIAAELEARWKK
jgi:hypothetical protein